MGAPFDWLRVGGELVVWPLIPFDKLRMSGGCRGVLGVSQVKGIYLCPL